ncbi:ribokinase [Roseibium marinum]|uniref:Ribokinase n=1 Tax=Roseibium marinum TaxID=281252 RepID=A0A2S3UKK3_9HYPH|nr:ribokinase [Roseibium marinum]POF28258.1 ribokinase [Roseibium marinum]
MRAYVIGNVAIDETISVSSFPQAGASLLGREQSRDLGGKGANQSVVCGRCGLPTTLIAAVGEGFRSRMIQDQLAREPIESELIRLSGVASDFSIVFTTPDGENAIVTTTEAAESLTLDAVLRTLSKARPGDIAVLQGNLSEAVTRGILKTAREKALVTAFNPSPLRSYFPDLWPDVDLAFLNKGEAQSLTGTDGEAAARKLLAEGVRQVVLTAGGEGATLADRTGFVSVPAFPATVLDTTGAGDTFMAVAIASSALRGCDLDERALRHASAASALTVGRCGTRSAFPTEQELAGILAD